MVVLAGAVVVVVATGFFAVPVAAFVVVVVAVVLGALAVRGAAPLVRRAETGTLATITRHEKAVAYVLGVREFTALVETMELLANPAARRAIPTC